MENGKIFSSTSIQCIIMLYHVKRPLRHMTAKTGWCDVQSGTSPKAPQKQ